MKRSGVTLIKPGSIIIILLAASVGFVVFNWSSGMLDATENQSTQDRRDSLSCSVLDLRFSSEKINSTHYSASVQPDQDIEAVAVTFEGDRNVTKIATDVTAGSFVEMKAKINNVSSVRANVKGCSRVFKD